MAWMKAYSWLLVVGLAGCNSDLPPCDSYDLYLDSYALLTGAPSFSASKIAPGDPITAEVPVDVNTRSVQISIRGIGLLPSTATDGDETVEIPVDNTFVPAGVYLLERIWIREGDHGEGGGFYTADDPGVYALYVGGVENVRGCLTDIPAPTFAVAEP